MALLVPSLVPLLDGVADLAGVLVGVGFVLGVVAVVVSGVVFIGGKHGVLDISLAAGKIKVKIYSYLQWKSLRSIVRHK